MYLQVPSLSYIDTWKNNTLNNKISDLFLFLIFTHSKSPPPPPLLCYRRATACTCDGAPGISVLSVGMCVRVYVWLYVLTKKRTYTWREKVSFVFSRFKLISTNWTNTMRKNAAPEREAPDARLLHHTIASQGSLFLCDVRVILMRRKHLRCTN